MKIQNQDTKETIRQLLAVLTLKINNIKYKIKEYQTAPITKYDSKQALDMDLFLTSQHKSKNPATKKTQ